MTEKTFTVAGVSKLAGQFKARFASDITRVKVLDKNGHTDINLIELPEAMDKQDAAEHLLTLPAFNSNVAIVAALQHVLGNKTTIAAAAPAAAVEEAAEVLAVEEEPAAEDNVIEVDLTAAVVPHKEFSMSPDAIRKREARAAAKQNKVSEEFAAWAAAADAEDAAEAEDIEHAA